MFNIGHWLRFVDNRPKKNVSSIQAKHEYT